MCAVGWEGELGEESLKFDLIFDITLYTFVYF